MKEPSVFVKDENPDWDKCESLEAWVVRQIIEGKQNTPEFQSSLAFWGRDRFEKIWKAYKSTSCVSGGGAA